MSDLEKINILVVDDVPEKLIAMQAILEEPGHNVVTARSGREALRALLNQDFAIILLDVNMPGMDGFETASLIRGRQRSEHTPIIFVTGYSDETHVSHGYSLGAVDYILTPVVPEVLRAKVAVFGELFRKAELIKRQAEQEVALAHEQLARAAAEEATLRSAFLADASTLLCRSLDVDATLTTSVELAAPMLADLAVLVQLDGPDDVKIARVAVVEQNKPRLVEVAPDSTLGPVLESYLASVLAQGTTKCFSESNAAPPWLAGERPARASVGPGAGASAAWLMAPLTARGKTRGALILAMLESNRRFGPRDVTMAEDLAGRMALAIDNARLYREILDGDRRKDEFLALLGHELRNPLAAALNAVELMTLAGAEDASTVRLSRDILERQLHRMLHLVEDLLDVARITQGKVRLRKDTVTLQRVLECAVESTRDSFSSRAHQITIQVPDEPIRIEGDETRLEQIFVNLLNNSAKYTEPGGRIAVTAKLAGDVVAIAIRDNGIGIQAELLPHIFDLFRQADRSADRSQGGLGIGLTLVHSLVKMHRGAVKVHSAGAGKGTEVTVQFPVMPQPPPEEARSASMPSRSIDSHPHCSQKRILIVDDNEDLASTMAKLFQSVGHEVRTVHDGTQALDAMSPFQPEVVLIDIGLPGMSGHEVARLIRRDHGTTEPLLIAMTGFGGAEDRRRSKEAGFDAHFVKPVKVANLEGLLAARTEQEPGKTAVAAAAYPA